MTVLIDLAGLAAAPVARDPFDHLVVPGFVPVSALPAIDRDFPSLDLPGSFPTSELRYGPAFRDLLEAVQGPEMTAAMAAKFDLDLARLPTMVTVRGWARPADGKIHLDSRTKVVTVLIYLNAGWDVPGGRLRLLRGPDDIENSAVEVPPDAGTLLAFRCGPTAWHGHKPVEGRRRSIQLNWVSGANVVRREQFRHRLSARVKKLKRLAGLG